MAGYGARIMKIYTLNVVVNPFMDDYEPDSCDPLLLGVFISFELAQEIAEDLFEGLQWRYNVADFDENHYIIINEYEIGKITYDLEVAIFRYGSILRLREDITA
jgi:hypothetical protein